MILADTSIWIDHLARGDTELAGRLESGQICIHSLVIGELACGSLRYRHKTLQQLSSLPRLDGVSNRAAIKFIDQHQIMSRGIGMIDVQLLAATAAVEGTLLWTRDRRLAEIANELGLGKD